MPSAESASELAPEPLPQPPRRAWMRALGPGIVYAGAAIGVSHLVQSTGAGARYGLSLVWLVLLAHAMKLPAMLFGPRYAAATGTSLLDAYRLQGRHALAAFGLIQVGTMFTIQAAVTIVTAAIAKPLLVDPALRAISDGLTASVPAVAAGVLAVCAAVLAGGGYAWLDRTIKALMVLLAISTVAAAAMQAPGLDLAEMPLLPSADELTTLAWVAFAVALVGWMPAPMDISVWHSLWSLARRKQTGHAATKRQCELDFLVGYGLCVVLAVAFMLLGAALLYRTGTDPAVAAGGFANQLISLYTDSLGAWSKPIIGLCAMAVMFSTTLTVLDALPRTMTELVRTWRASEGAPSRAAAASNGVAYWIWLAVIAAGALVIITFFSGGAGMKSLVDLATTLSFLGTPVIAWFNHRAMTAGVVPIAHRPGLGLRVWSVAGIGFWTVFAAVYLTTLFIARG